MIHRTIASWLVGCFFTSMIHAQNPVNGQWMVEQHESAASLRGLCVVDAQVAWTSGTGNTVLRTTDGGSNWESIGPDIDVELDFRDIEAFDKNRAIIVSAGSPARIYKTANGGKSWKLVFEESREAAFFDAMAFWDNQNGVAFSDPIDQHLLLVATNDGGNTWKELPRDQQPKTLANEAGFAASGTCMTTAGETSVWVGLGGDTGEPARILHSSDRGKTWSVQITSIQTSPSSGIFSIAFADEKHGVAVGGTYDDPDKKTSNIVITTDGGITWQKPEGNQPGGYRSCVAVRKMDDKVLWIAVGRNGCDISSDNGNTWVWQSDEPFHAVAFSDDGKTGIAIGRDGRIGQWKD